MDNVLCDNCGWNGKTIEVIQAGLNYELCPQCETILVAWYRPSLYYRIVQKFLHYRLVFRWWWNRCPPPF